MSCCVPSSPYHEDDVSFPVSVSHHLSLRFPTTRPNFTFVGTETLLISRASSLQAILRGVSSRMPSGPLLAFSGLMTVLNRGLAWIDFAVHHASGYFFYWFLRGMKPQTHTRPRKLPDGRSYSPSVVITGASQGLTLSSLLSCLRPGRLTLVFRNRSLHGS
jgi:hypothetical protein